jgi:hypothetical protein
MVHLCTDSQHLTHMHIMASLSQHAHYCTGNILYSLVPFILYFHAYLSPKKKICGVSNIKCSKSDERKRVIHMLDLRFLQW